MVRPVADRRDLTGKTGQPTSHELAEGLPGDVDVAAVAVDEVHRHIEHPVDIALEAEAVLEDEGGDAGPVRVGIGPDDAAERQVPRWLAVAERGAGEQRRGDRLQGEADAEHPHHRRLGIEIEVDLYGAGRLHHIEAEAAPLRHVRAHDRVATLRPPRALLAPPPRLIADAEKADV